MKRFIMGAVLCTVLSCVGLSQVTLPTIAIRDNLDTVNTAFIGDSVYLGSNAYDRWVEVLNDGSVDLFVAIQNDTTHSVRIRSGTTEPIFCITRLSREVRWLRTKAASSTCIRRVRWGLLKP